MAASARRCGDVARIVRSIRTMRSACPLGAALALIIAVPAAANFPQGVDGKVQPNGTLTATSSTIPKSAKSATITVKPKADDRDDFFNTVESMLAATRSKRDRVLVCVGMYQGIVGLWGEEMSFAEAEPELGALFLRACLQVAFQNHAANARAAATPCPALPVSVPMRVSRTSAGYRIAVKGTAKKPRRRPLRVRCTRVDGAMKIRMRPRSRTRSLRSVVGRKLAIGFYNTGTRKAVRMRTTFAVR